MATFLSLCENRWLEIRLNYYSHSVVEGSQATPESGFTAGIQSILPVRNEGRKCHSCTLLKNWKDDPIVFLGLDPRRDGIRWSQAKRAGSVALLYQGCYKMGWNGTRMRVSSFLRGRRQQAGCTLNQVLSFGMEGVDICAHPFYRQGIVLASEHSIILCKPRSNRWGISYAERACWKDGSSPFLSWSQGEGQSGSISFVKKITYKLSRENKAWMIETKEVHRKVHSRRFWTLSQKLSSYYVDRRLSTCSPCLHPFITAPQGTRSRNRSCHDWIHDSNWFKFFMTQNFYQREKLHKALKINIIH